MEDAEAGEHGGIPEALVKVVVVAPRGLQDRTGHTAPKHPVAHGTANGLVVPEYMIDATVEEVDVELRPAAINVSNYAGAGLTRFFHSCPCTIRVRALPSVEVEQEWIRRP